MQINIKTVSPDQFAETVRVEKDAFKHAEHSDGTEHLLITKLRQEKLYNPDFDIVATLDDGKIVGHAMLSAATIKTESSNISGQVFVLAPLAVLPEVQGQGIGTHLIKELERRATNSGVLAISILGDPDYYGRFGYVPADTFDIQAPFEVESKFFMMKELRKDALKDISGILEYQNSFGI